MTWQALVGQLGCLATQVPIYLTNQVLGYLTQQGSSSREGSLDHLKMGPTIIIWPLPQPATCQIRPISKVQIGVTCPQLMRALLHQLINSSTQHLTRLNPSIQLTLPLSHSLTPLPVTMFRHDHHLVGRLQYSPVGNTGSKQNTQETHRKYTEMAARGSSTTFYPGRGLAATNISCLLYLHTQLLNIPGLPMQERLSHSKCISVLGSQIIDRHLLHCHQAQSATAPSAAP